MNAGAAFLKMCPEEIRDELRAITEELATLNPAWADKAPLVCLVWCVRELAKLRAERTT